MFADSQLTARFSIPSAKCVAFFFDRLLLTWMSRAYCSTECILWTKRWSVISVGFIIIFSFSFGSFIPFTYFQFINSCSFTRTWPFITSVSAFGSIVHEWLDANFAARLCTSRVRSLLYETKLQPTFFLYPSLCPFCESKSQQMPASTIFILHDPNNISTNAQHPQM
jgi:hypothetical protein